MNNRVTIIGAGNGGQAMAGHIAMKGYQVCLYCRDLPKIGDVLISKRITLYGAINGSGTLSLITDSIEEAVIFADIIMIVTTANAHRELAIKMSPFLRDHQIVVLNPGRTGGAFEFKKNLHQGTNVSIHLAEAQTLVYACRVDVPGRVHIVGEKNRVLLSGFNKNETDNIIAALSSLYNCFMPAKNLLHTSLENIGAIFHPCVILFNTATIERGVSFYFYRDMTPHIAEFMEKVDRERVNVGKAYGVELITAVDWISYAYPHIAGGSLCERMRNNPAYNDILAPASIYSRQLMEDIPTGLYPIVELGKLAGLDMPLMDSIITICSSLLNMDFRLNGRSLDRMGLEGLRKDDVITYFQK
jgi:opine dehydrogenase